jgi:hypothetical protein
MLERSFALTPDATKPHRSWQFQRGSEALVCLDEPQLA